jgi:DNA adenine methylase
MKPFLKWAGNKYPIIGPIRSILSTLPGHGRLIEPFAGSAAVFLNTQYHHTVLSDINDDLIGLYQMLQVEGPEFIDFCRAYFTDVYNTPEQFYQLREQFNRTDDRAVKSALFIYLNRHCFNGLCRYNLQGEFNVPFGRYKKPYFPQAEMQAFYEKSQSAEIRHQDFVSAMQAAEPGDVIYCDPPYVPLSATANFTSYSKGAFSMPQQEQLATLAGQLAQRGVYVLISNHNTAFTQQVYQSAQI